MVSEKVFLSQIECKLLNTLSSFIRLSFTTGSTVTYGRVLIYVESTKTLNKMFAFGPPDSL